MTRTSRIFQTLAGTALAFLVGVAAMAAQDKAQTAKPEAAKQESAAPAPAKPAAPAPGLPGWIKHLPADKKDAATAIWLVDGRVITGYKEMVTAKRHELDALLTLPNTDDKAVQAVVKEIAANEEKLLNAEIAFRRNLEKAGIPAWGHVDHGKHRMMDHGSMMGGGKMGGGKMGMMGMMKGGDKDKDASSGEDKKEDAGHSGH